MRGELGRIQCQACTDNHLSYYQVIHVQFPILSEERDEIATMVKACPVSLRMAFFRAMRTGTGLLSRSHQCKEILNSLQNDVASNPASRSPMANLIYLQTLIFLIVATELNGPLSMQPPDAPMKGQFFGMAGDIASHLKLRTSNTNMTITPEAKLVHATGRRAWWFLLILDSWNAIGSGNSPQILDRGIKPVNEDCALLGDTLHFFARK